MKYHTKNKKEYFMFLDIFKIKKYSNKQFNSWQLDEIQKGKETGVDTSIYAYPQIKPYEIEKARNALILGAAPDSVKMVIDESLKGNIKEGDMEKILENSIYVVDMEFLISKYVPDGRPEESEKPHIKEILYGTVFGDIAGSQYEFTLNTDERENLTIDNCIIEGSMFTDDTVLTCATASIVRQSVLKLEQRNFNLNDYKQESTYPFIKNPFVEAYRKYTLEFPGQGYGPGFYHWAIYNYDTPYGSYGNGSAMRVSPIGAWFDDIKDVILYAVASAAATHNHPEGIKGSVITAVSIWMARKGYSKEQIYKYMMKHYRGVYGFSKFSFDEIKNPVTPMKSDATCQFSIPAAVICFYNSDSYESTINNVLSFRGDTDTIGAIAGAIAAAYYGVSKMVIEIVNEYKPEGIFDEALSALEKEEP